MTNMDLYEQLSDQVGPEVVYYLGQADLALQFKLPNCKEPNCLLPDGHQGNHFSFSMNFNGSNGSGYYSFWQDVMSWGGLFSLGDVQVYGQPYWIDTDGSKYVDKNFADSNHFIDWTGYTRVESIPQEYRNVNGISEALKVREDQELAIQKRTYHGCGDCTCGECDDGNV